MRNKAKAMLGKVASIIKGNSIFCTRHWPIGVLSNLEEKYQLSPREMRSLWYIRHKISDGRYPVYSLQIYDWTKATEKRIRVKSNKDLDKNSDLLLFKGNIFGDGSIRLDRVNN